MNSQILKLNLDNLPWTEYYDEHVLTVTFNTKMRTVDDRYADDMNFGLYRGDDVSAYYHARGTYEKLRELKHKEQTEELLL